MRSSICDLLAVGIVLLLSAVLSGCSSQSTQRRPVTSSSQSLQAFGVLVLPPAGDGWYVSEQKSAAAWNVLFEKEPRPEDSDKKIRVTTFVRVNVERVDRESIDKKYPSDRAALEHVRDQLAAPASGRFVDAPGRTSWSTLQGATCLRYSRSTEERQNPADPSAVLIIETENACCFHPRDRNVAVWIQVSRRFPRGTAASAVDNLMTTFLQNVRFEPAK